MATRGSIPKIMEMAGVDMLDPQVGVPWIRRELTEGGRSGEVVVAGQLGAMAAPSQLAGGIAPSIVADAGPMIGTVELDTDGLVVRTTLDPVRQPFLDDHRIDGTAVLPGVRFAGDHGSVWLTMGNASATVPCRFSIALAASSRSSPPCSPLPCSSGSTNLRRCKPPHRTNGEC